MIHTVRKLGKTFQKNMCSFIKNNISNVKSKFLNRAYRGQNATCSGIYHYPGIWHSDQGRAFTQLYPVHIYQ